MNLKLISIRNTIKQILLWSVKYTKTDMLYVARSSFWITASKIFLNASALIMSIVYANLISKETYGFFKYIISLGGIISSFSLTGADTALTKAVAKGANGMLKETFWASLRWSFAIPIISFGTAVYYYLNGNTTMAISLLIISFLLPIQESSGVYRAYLNGKKDFKLRTTYDIIQSFVGMLLIILTILITKKPIYLIFIYYTFNTLIIFYYYVKTLNNQKNETLLYDNTTINFAKHLTVIGFIGSIYQYIDKVLVFHFLGAGQLAIYSFATIPISKIEDAVKTLVKDISFPKLSAKNLTEIKKTLLSKMLKLFFIAVPITVGYILVVPFLFKLLFPAYLASIKFSQALALTLLFIPDALLSQTLIAHAKKKTLYFFNLTTSLIGISGLFIFLPLYGIWGVVISKLISQTSNFIFLIVAYKKLNGYRNL